MILPDGVEKLRGLVGISGTLSDHGIQRSCKIEAVIINVNGIQLVLRDRHGRQLKRNPSKFERDKANDD